MNFIDFNNYFSSLYNSILLGIIAGVGCAIISIFISYYSRFTKLYSSRFTLFADGVIDYIYYYWPSAKTLKEEPGSKRNLTRISVLY